MGLLLNEMKEQRGGVRKKKEILITQSEKSLYCTVPVIVTLHGAFLLENVCILSVHSISSK